MNEGKMTVNQYTNVKGNVFIYETRISDGLYQSE